MGTLQLFSKEFALGFIGMMIGTGYLAQAIKSIPPIARYFKVRRKFCGMMCALAAAFICAVAYQVAEAVLSEVPFSWSTIPATTIVYATASSFAYEWFIKKTKGDDELPPE